MTDLVLFGSKGEWLEPNADSISELTDGQRAALETLRSAVKQAETITADLKAAQATVIERQKIHVAAMAECSRIVPKRDAVSEAKRWIAQQQENARRA